MKTIRITRSEVPTRKVQRTSKNIQVVEYSKSIERSRVSLHFELVRKSTLVL